MNNNELAAQAQRYKDEMMKIYGKSTSVPEQPKSRELPAEKPAPQVMFMNAEDTDIPGLHNADEANENSDPGTNRQPVPEIRSEPSQFSQPDAEVTDEEISESGIPSIDENYPEPDLSELDETAPENSVGRESVPNTKLGNSEGFIQVSVRTGDESSPVSGAFVTVSAISDGLRFFITSGTTDESGRTEKFTVPVPDSELSLSPDSRIRPYGLFDISVTANGFFNARSVDVPVFNGITSLQNFSMIPVPQFMQANDETIVNFNQEPQL